MSEHHEECCSYKGDKAPDSGKTSCWFGKWAGLLVASLESDRRKEYTVEGANPPLPHPRDPRKLLSGGNVKPEC